MRERIAALVHGMDWRTSVVLRPLLLLVSTGEGTAARVDAGRGAQEQAVSEGGRCGRGGSTQAGGC